jgi:biopolymer transport protein ExbD
MKTCAHDRKSLVRVALVALTIVVVTAMGGAPVFGQDPYIRLDNLDRLAARAVETVDVTVDASMIHMASKFLNANKVDEAKLRELLEQLKGVNVKVFEFANDGDFTAEDVEAIRAQLSAPGWSKVAAVRGKRTGGGEDVDVRFMIEGELIKGIAILVVEPRELVFVNVIGPIDPEKISQLNLLEGRFGIPRIGLGLSDMQKNPNKN